MVKFRDVKLTPDLVRRAMQCQTPGELMAALREIDIDITKEEAEKALENLAEIDLSSEQMKAVAGGNNGWDDVRKDFLASWKVAWAQLKNDPR